MANYLLRRISIIGYQPPGIEELSYSAFSAVVNDNSILLYDDDNNLQESIIIDTSDHYFEFINKDDNTIVYPN